MILYHGTNADIEAIDLTKGLRYKDFGKGFYLTPERMIFKLKNSRKEPARNGFYLLMLIAIRRIPIPYIIMIS